jgi:[acyl-carrier-protein] S-malonyltransferase
MCKELYDTMRSVQELFEEASACLSTNFVKRCFADSDAELSKPENAYTALFLVQRACTQVLAEHGVMPTIASGHDMGIYGAASAANSLSFTDGLYVLNKWGKLYSQFLSTHSYTASLVSKVHREDILYACGKAHAQTQSSIALACLELNGKYIVTGEPAALTAFAPIARRRGASVKRFSVGGGVYTDWVKPLLPYYALSFTKIDCHSPQLPIFSPYHVTKIQEAEALKHMLLYYAAEPIFWRQAAESIVEEADILVVPFPRTKFYDEIQRAFPHKQVFCVTNRTDIEAIAQAVLQLKGRS